MIIVDADILSMFAKAGSLNVLIEFFGKEQIGMTPAIADEISVPLQYGYSFPLQILSQIPVVPISKSVDLKVSEEVENEIFGQNEEESPS